MKSEYIETCGLEVREHLEMARGVEVGFIYLEEESISEERVTKSLNRMKTTAKKKTVGTNKIKTEFNN